MTPGAKTVQRGRDELPNDSLYNGATHWSAMLEDMEELRTAIREHDDIDGAGIDLDSDEGDGTSLLFGATKPLPFQQVLSQFLPLRPEADRLVAAYFRAKAVAAPFIHAAHFSRLYRLFWDNPSSASPLWTSILFSILDIATRTLSTSPGASTGENSKANRFAIAAAHCLAVGEYYRPQRFAVEALLLYVQSQCLTSVDVSPVVAILSVHSLAWQRLWATTETLTDLEKIYLRSRGRCADVPGLCACNLTCSSLSNSGCRVIFSFRLGTQGHRPIYWTLIPMKTQCSYHPQGRT